MNYGQSFRLAIKALATSKMRSLLTMLGIIIGVAAVIIILALGNGLTGMVQQQVDKLGVNMMMTYVWGRGDGSTSTLDPQDMYDLVEENPDAGWLIMNGNRAQIKRRQFEKVIDSLDVI